MGPSGTGVVKEGPHWDEGGPQCHRLLGWHRDTWVPSSGAVPGGMQGASWASGKKTAPSSACSCLSACFCLQQLLSLPGPPAQSPPCSEGGPGPLGGLPPRVSPGCPAGRRQSATTGTPRQALPGGAGGALPAPAPACAHAGVSSVRAGARPALGQGTSWWQGATPGNGTRPLPVPPGTLVSLQVMGCGQCHRRP